MSIVHIKSLPTTSSRKDVFFSVLQVFGASLLLAVCSQISLPLYFSPVPLSGQTFAVMFIGATMGSRRGLLSVLLYLAEGYMGFPVFAGGSFGILHLIGPRAGYLFGFLVQVYLVGWFVERQASLQWLKIMITLLFSCACQLGLGVLWLSTFVGYESALSMGLYPFMLGELMKIVILTVYLKIFPNEKYSHLY